MARTTVAEVRQVISSASADAIVTAMIGVASTVVDNYLAADSTLNAVTLEEIERWIAAHLVALYDERGNSESIGDASRSYGPAEIGLSQTRWGQTAIMLDTTGKLKNAGRSVPVVLRML